MRLSFSKLLGTLSCDKICIYLLRIHYKKIRKGLIWWWLCDFFSDFLFKSIYCGYSFELHRQVDAIQTSTHNICLYKEVKKKRTLAVIWRPRNNCALIGVCAVIRSNTVSGSPSDLQLTMWSVAYSSSMPVTCNYHRFLFWEAYCEMESMNNELKIPLQMEDCNFYPHSSQNFFRVYRELYAPCKGWQWVASTLDLVGLEFNGPVNTIKVILSLVSLPNHTFPGRITRRLTSTCTHSFTRNWWLPFLNKRKRMTTENI